MKTYAQTVRREAQGVVAGLMSGGSKSPPYQVVHAIARIYEVSSDQLYADIDALLSDREFMREAKGSC